MGGEFIFILVLILIFVREMEGKVNTRARTNFTPLGDGIDISVVTSTAF
jgi:hypothetical protein